MAIGFIELGFIVQIFGIGILVFSALRYLTRIRVVFPRLFDEYKQDQLLDNVKIIDHSLSKFTQFFFFGGFITILGIGLVWWNF